MHVRTRVVLTAFAVITVTGGSLSPTLTFAGPVGGLTLSASVPFGNFGGVTYLRHSGSFEGITSLGEFRVPFEIVAPEAPELGNGAVLFEPPHFAFGPVGRDFLLGRELLFNRGFSYVAVGFGANGLNVLDPTAEGIVIAGVEVASPGTINLLGVVDEEIIVQFVEALSTDPVAIANLGAIAQHYAYGISQTGAVLLETLLSPFAGDLFDFTLLHVTLWRPPFQPPGVLERLDGEFVPPSGSGRVVFVASEGDQLVSDAEQFRRVLGRPEYRLYEVAGAPHQPSPGNPLDHAMVARALLVRGDLWARNMLEPPPSTVLEEAPEGEVDAVYGVITGIARDADLNARGGVRFPDVQLGRARFVAADFSVAPLPGLNGLLGAMVDLACEPPPGAGGDAPRFVNHGDYVSQYVRIVNQLRSAGFLLDADAETLKQFAESSEVGKPQSCG